MEKIFLRLSEGVTEVIASGNCVQHLEYLFRFLATWEQRPSYLAPMAYQWCSAFSEMITGPGQDGTYTRQAHPSWPLLSQWIGGALRGFEIGFAKVGPGCDPAHRTRRRQIERDPDSHSHTDLLFTALEVGFRIARLGHDWSAIRLDHSPHHTRVFEVAFSSDHDEVIADAAYAWVAGSGRAPAGSLARYFAKRVERTTPFSPRLRRVGIRAIGLVQPSEPDVSAPEIVRLLNRLEADVDDVVKKEGWVNLLVGTIRLPMGFESLSSCDWRLLGKLTSTTGLLGYHLPRDMEVMRSLEEVEDWEKLEVWMVVMWMLRPVPAVETVQGIGKATIKLFSRQPSVLQRFENLWERDAIPTQYKVELRGIWNQARAEQLPSESPLPQYVSVPLVQHVSVLMPPFLTLQLIDSRPAPYFPSFFGRRRLMRVSVAYTTG